MICMSSKSPCSISASFVFFFKDKKVEFLTGRVRLETADLLRESWLGN